MLTHFQREPIGFAVHDSILSKGGADVTPFPVISALGFGGLQIFEDLLWPYPKVANTDT